MLPQVSTGDILVCHEANNALVKSALTVLKTNILSEAWYAPICPVEATYRKDAGSVTSAFSIDIWRIEAWPPTGDRIHTAISKNPGRVTIRSWNCDVNVLVSDVLAASVSSMPMLSPFSRRHSRIKWAARPTTVANRSGKTVGPWEESEF